MLHFIFCSYLVTFSIFCQSSTEPQLVAIKCFQSAVRRAILLFWRTMDKVNKYFVSIFARSNSVHIIIVNNQIWKQTLFISVCILCSFRKFKLSTNNEITCSSNATQVTKFIVWMECFCEYISFIHYFFTTRCVGPLPFDFFLSSALPG